MYPTYKKITIHLRPELNAPPVIRENSFFSTGPDEILWIGTGMDEYGMNGRYTDVIAPGVWAWVEIDA